MAYFHKLIVIGKLVSDPKSFDFSTGGRVAKFGLPVDFARRKKNPATGEWEGESFIIDVSAFNRDNYKLADNVLQYLHKGSQVYVEGRLRPNEYTDKNGVKVFKPVLVADVVQFLDSGQDAGMAAGANRPATSTFQRPPANGGSRPGEESFEDAPVAPESPSEDSIPF
jgi:single-strand DNA-binding protein